MKKLIWCLVLALIVLVPAAYWYGNRDKAVPTPQADPVAMATIDLEYGHLYPMASFAAMNQVTYDNNPVEGATITSQVSSEIMLISVIVPVESPMGAYVNPVGVPYWARIKSGLLKENTGIPVNTVVRIMDAVTGQEQFLWHPAYKAPSTTRENISLMALATPPTVDPLVDK